MEFETRRLTPAALEAPLRGTRARLTSLLARARLVRVVVVVLGAAAIAFFTQRVGIELTGALCLFLVALPVLWVGGWLLGFFSSARRAARQAVREEGSGRWQVALEHATITEKVKLSAASGGLLVTRSDGAQLVPWREVRIERVNPGALAVYLASQSLAMNEGLLVPRAAFASPEAFDAFCLLLQRFVWEAQR